VNPDVLVDRFGASSIEPVHGGLSGASVARLIRGAEVLFHKQGPGVGDEADRLVWLGSTGFPCPRVIDRGDDWMLSTSLPGRDASEPWSESDRSVVLTAMAEGLKALHSLTESPFSSPFPGGRSVVTHGDYCAPNVFVDPGTLRFSGVLDVGGLGLGDPYVDVALMVKSLTGRNPQYGGLPAARAFVAAYGADPEDPRIKLYMDLDSTGNY
jgi:kanamycin kinase/aminoglycoside 3'-phosphotransferase-2